MSKFHLNFFWLLLAGSMLASCHSSKKLTKEATNDYESWEPGLLWEVTGNGLEAPSYVFGTIHIIGKDDYFLPDGFEGAFARSNEVVFEIDIEDMMDLSSQFAMLNKAFMNDGLTIKDLLTDEEYQELNAYFKDLGIPLFFLERLKPMFLTILTSMDGDLEDMQSTSTSYEFEILAMASANNKPTGGLETIDFQIGLFDSIPYKEQAQMLMESIRTQSSGSEQFDKMIELYKSQNIENMVHTIGEDESLSKYEDLLLDKRNINWIPTMADKMSSRSTFFAVGAGHLGGPNGVLNLLRQEGFTIKKVKG